MSNLKDSQIAAQAAMQHQTSSQHMRKRSQTVPSPQSPPQMTGRRKPPPLQCTTDATKKPSKVESPKQQQYQNGLVGGRTAAATAANAAFPRSGQLSPGLTTFEAPEKEHKLKSERSKMKLFSKPKQLGISSSKDVEQKDRPLPSPNKIGFSGPNALSNIVNPSMTNLADSTTNPSSFYMANNGSTSTLVPQDRQAAHEKEKSHRHHFLSRQKNKFKEKIVDEHPLPLPSVSSISKPLDSTTPQSLYSFAPSSPAPTTTTFSKSVSGLDLRHGGRALREKKKEERASAALPVLDPKRADMAMERALTSSLASSGAHSFLGPIIANNASIFGGQSNPHTGELSTSQAGLQGFGLSNMSREDAWDFLKAKLLIVFEGEELRMPVEDLNRLVSAHIQHCISKQTPDVITEDLRDLLQTGFRSLEQTLRGVLDHRLVPALVDVWLFVFGTILPYMQAVFLPLDLEYKGHEGAKFWGSAFGSSADAFGHDFTVRRIVLISYRDTIVLPRHDALSAIFSRLSLDSINASVSLVSSNSPDRGARPSTAASLDPGIASFTSQGSTLLGDGNRSRAASNLSAPEFPPLRAQRPTTAASSAQVTQLAARMLQCVSVLASVQSGDGAQAKMEELARELKLNWLGRGRTGRNRKGFVQTKLGARAQGNSEQDGRSGGQSML